MVIWSLGTEIDGVKYEWSLLRSGSIIRQFSDANTLKIRKADPSIDYGVYRCEVENEDGELLGQAYTAVTVGYTEPSSLLRTFYYFDLDLEKIGLIQVFQNLS